jgi:hypothetical protein
MALFHVKQSKSRVRILPMLLVRLAGSVARGDKKLSDEQAKSKRSSFSSNAIKHRG